MTPLKIVFAGTPEFALPSLKALLHAGHDILAVYTQPDRPAGRGRKLQASAVKQLAVAHQLRIHQPLNFKDPAEVRILADMHPDVMVVIAYGLILPQAVLDIPRYGCVNVHGSLLPRWRGASPIQQSILQGDTESGITLMQMDRGMDTGNILKTSSCPVDARETAKSLHDKLSRLAAEPLLHTLDSLVSGTAVPLKQDSALATYAPKISKEDARISWQAPAKQIDQMIRAYNPWPIAYTQAGGHHLRIYDAEVSVLKHSHCPGTVIRIEKTGLLVAAGEDALCIKQLQFPGGKILSVSEWFNASHSQLSAGQVLE